MSDLYKKTILLCFTIFVIVVFAYPLTATLIWLIVQAKYPDNNKRTGCPNGLEICTPEQKMLCYQNDISMCYIAATPSLILFIAFAFVLTIRCQTSPQKSGADDSIELSEREEEEAQLNP